MVVSAELWIAVSASTCQPLRLTWNIITYRFAGSIVTNVYMIFEYIYNFPIHVSSDIQTDRLFTSLGCSHPLGNNYYEDDSLNIESRALGLRGEEGRPRGEAKYYITHDAQS